MLGAGLSKTKRANRRVAVCPSRIARSRCGLSSPELAKNADAQEAAAHQEHAQWFRNILLGPATAVGTCSGDVIAHRGPEAERGVRHRRVDCYARHSEGERGRPVQKRVVPRVTSD